MRLTSAYRSQLALRQSCRWLIYLGIAGALHAGGWLLGSWLWQRGLSETLPVELTSIEFVDVDVDIDLQSVAPTPATQRRAQVSVAARSVQENRPLQTQGPASPVPSTSPPVSRGSLGVAALPSSPPVADPLSAETSVAPGNEPVLAEPVASPQVLPPPAIPSPQTESPELSAAASQLGPPLAVDATTGEGHRGQSNPESPGTGSHVNALGDPLWGPYMATVNRQVDQQWQRLNVPVTRQAKVRFRIDRQGRLSDVELLQPSGDPLADQAAIQAIWDAAPFAPLPQSAPEEILIVNFTFTYHGAEALP
ncbi:MAG: TonB family protein [Synechococcales cyanobacterium C42_A2020_086]|nr:TonB family protein [Synechococcales cyanobacterium C42_A2020_086]